MSDIDIVQHLSDGLTVKEIAAMAGYEYRHTDYLLQKMRTKYLAATIHHLVAIFLRKGLIK